MGKIWLVLVGLVFVIGSINFITAGTVSTEATATSAKQIKLSGEIDIPMISRDSGVNSVLDGVTTPGSQDGDTIWSPLITLNFGIDVGDKITSLVQLQNRRLNTGVGTAANVDFLGNNNIDPAVKQAYVKFEKFVTQDLNFTYGLQNLKFALRESDGAFFLDTGNASPNFVNGLLTEPNGAVWRRSKSANEFGGFRFDYGSLKNSNYQGTLFIGKITETATGVDQLHNDNQINGAIAWYKLDDDKVFNAIVTQMLNAKNESNIQTIGVGANYGGAIQNLGLFGEFYTQSGDATKTMKQAATAFQAGAHYDVKHDLKPYVELSYWLLSGGGTASKNENFVSLENVKSTMILEDNVFGLNLDSNYTAIKVETGITTKVDIDKDGTSEELKVKLLIGQFSLTDQPTGMTGVSDKLGTEVDLVGTLQFNPSVGFTLGYATLSGGKFFTDPLTYNADSSSMRMIIFCTNLKF
ncbi:MAG: hypothetical protein V1709_10585 [Planctomycetota bacterium]